MPRQTLAKFTNKNERKLPAPMSVQGAVPVPVQAPVPALHQKSSLADVVKEGFAFGVGSSVARNIIDRFMAPSDFKPIDSKVDKPMCFEYQQCMEESAHNHDACKHHLE